MHLMGKCAIPHQDLTSIRASFARPSRNGWDVLKSGFRQRHARAHAGRRQNHHEASEMAWRHARRVRACFDEIFELRLAARWIQDDRLRIVSRSLKWSWRRDVVGSWRWKLTPWVVSFITRITSHFRVTTCARAMSLNSDLSLIYTCIWKKRRILLR